MSLSNSVDLSCRRCPTHVAKRCIGWRRSLEYPFLYPCTYRSSSVSFYTLCALQLRSATGTTGPKLCNKCAIILTESAFLCTQLDRSMRRHQLNPVNQPTTITNRMSKHKAIVQTINAVNSRILNDLSLHEYFSIDGVVPLDIREPFAIYKTEMSHFCLIVVLPKIPYSLDVVRITNYCWFDASLFHVCHVSTIYILPIYMHLTASTLYWLFLFLRK